MKRVEDFFKPAPVKLPPDELKAVEPATKPAPKKIEVSLKTVVRDTSKPTPDTTAADEAREAKRLRDQRTKALKSALTSIKENASSATTVEMPGNGSVSYANYASVVKSIYDRAWTPPTDMTSDDVTTKVTVTIGRDGRVISSRIIERSGESRVDASVQRVLDRVDFVAPFPDGATEKERTFTIYFNPQAKRMNG
jgi:TonB family protein